MAYEGAGHSDAHSNACRQRKGQDHRLRCVRSGLSYRDMGHIPALLRVNTPTTEERKSYLWGIWAAMYIAGNLEAPDLGMGLRPLGEGIL